MGPGGEEAPAVLCEGPTRGGEEYERARTPTSAPYEGRMTPAEVKGRSAEAPGPPVELEAQRWSQWQNDYASGVGRETGLDPSVTKTVTRE